VLDQVKKTSIWVRGVEKVLFEVISSLSKKFHENYCRSGSDSVLRSLNHKNAIFLFN